MSFEQEAKPKTTADVEAPRTKQGTASPHNARQQSMGEIGNAIQRQAKAGAEPSPDQQGADVQEKAEAGVAGANAPLPHGDRIQQSFGKHDISGVRAQVGGEAAQASEGLGAKAYATDSRIAFAEQPDLHTAAHEAAHTVQQRGGAVSFKGLGPSNDAHEQQADRVADAVVAGESAEPLLDQATGGGGSSGAVQRKTESETNVDSILASLRAAEFEFDDGRAELAQSAKELAKGIKSNDLQRMQYHWTTGLAHLNYARGRIAAASGDPAFGKVKTQMDETSRALDDYLEASLLSSESEKIVPMIDGVMPTHSAIRKTLGLPEVAKKASRKKETKGDDFYEGDSAAGAFQVAAVEAGKVYSALAADKGDRGTAVTTGAGAINTHLRYAMSMLRKVDEANKPTHKPAVEAASQSIAKVLRWIRGRPGNASLKEAFSDTVRLIDGARTFVKLGGIDETIDEVAIGSGEVEEERDEDKKVTQAKDDLRDAYVRLRAGYDAGMREFEKLAGIKEVSPPSFWAELGKAVLVAAIGHVTGGIGGLVVGRAVAALGKSGAADKVVSALKDVMIDSTQGIAGKVADDAFASSDAEAANTRLFAGFVRGLDLNNADTERTQKAKVNELVAKGKVTEADLIAMREGVDASIDDAHVVVVQAAAAAWAGAVAKSKVGANIKTNDKGKPVDSTTKMEGYFGSMEHTNPNYDWVEREDSKWGTNGMLRITVQIADDADAADSTPIVKIHSIDALGMNRDMALAMVMSGKTDFKQLKDIAAPKEIMVWRGTHDGYLVVDEKGAVKDAFRWDRIRRWKNTGGMDRAPNPRFYEEPESFWKHVGQLQADAKKIK